MPAQRAKGRFVPPLRAHKARNWGSAASEPGLVPLLEPSIRSELIWPLRARSNQTCAIFKNLARELSSSVAWQFLNIPRQTAGVRPRELVLLSETTAQWFDAARRVFRGRGRLLRGLLRCTEVSKRSDVVGHSLPSHSAVARINVCFSNRPVGVKHFQAIHHFSVDVAHGLVLLFGIGTKALPSWDSKTRRNNLLGGLAVKRTAGPSGHANSPHPSSREGHRSTARWSSSFLLLDLIL